MKKWIAGIIIIAILFLAAVYIFIPSTLTVSNAVYCKATLPGAYRMLSSNAKLKRWWIDKGAIAQNKFTYHDDVYILNNTYLYGALINIQHKNETIKSDIRILELVYDSVIIEWNFDIHTSANPFKRIIEYREAVVLKKNTDEVLNHFKNFIEKDSNVYGMPIKLSSIEHIFMITTKKVFTHNPSTIEVYGNINLLKQFAATHNLKQDYYPMMNVIKNNDTSYRLMTALPVNKESNFFGGAVNSVRMVKGNFMVTEAKGGYGTINNALNEIQLYFDDYGKTAMAIPFQYIVTDRMNEPDTAKWITKIYAPVY